VAAPTTQRRATPPAAAPFMPGAGGTTPPPSIPLGFLALSGIGLWAFGVAVSLAADRLVTTPSHPGALAAVHVGMLAFLTTAVLGAIHQFAPVVGRRPLRSIPAARFTLVGMALTGWLIPSGFAHGPEALVATGGVIGALTVTLAAWNLSGPLAARDGGVPLNGLRLSIGYLLITVAFGVVYAFNRQTGWFPLLPNRVLAHAHLGLVGWLGLTYVAVAEKLWPMFLLAHRPRARAGAWAVGLLAAGTPILATGLLFAVPVLGWLGGLVVVAGMGCHLTSLYTAVRHRRRALELLHGYLFTSATFAVIAVGLGATAALAEVDYATRSTLVVAEVTALAAWLSLAVVGHAHKIVPFIGYTVLRSRGIATGPSGRPLMFGDLFHHRTAQASLVVAVAGFDSVLVGVLIRSAPFVAVGGLLVSLTGLIVTTNLVQGPRRAIRTHRSAMDTVEVAPPPSARPAS
jgi:hypothetical protein